MLVGPLLMTTRKPFTAQQLRKLEPEQGRAWGGMLRAYARLLRRLDAELRAEHDLTFAEFEVLLVLAFCPERRMRMSDLAEALVVTNSGITRLVDRLLAANLLKRENSVEDRRVNYASLTDAGLAALMPAHASHLEGVKRHFLDHCTPADLKMLHKLSERVLEGLADSSPR